MFDLKRFIIIPAGQEYPKILNSLFVRWLVKIYVAMLEFKVNLKSLILKFLKAALLIF